MNQTKNDFWITMTLKTHKILWYHTSVPGATSILFHPKMVEDISLQKNVSVQKNISLQKFTSVKDNNENEFCWWALWTSMPNKWIFVLEITMLHDSYKKK